MLNTKSSERATWVIHREYTDSQGNLYVEYKDTKGIIHTEMKNPTDNAQSYQQGYVAGQIIEENNQDEQISQTKRADKNISQGLLLGVIVTCVAGLSAGIIYFLVNANQPQPATIINVPRQESSPVPSPLTVAPVAPQPVVKIVPVPQTQPREVKVNITTQPAPSKPQAKSEKVKVTKATAQPVVKASPKSSPKAIAQTAKTPVAAPLPNNVINNITNTTKTEPTEKPKAAVTNEVPKPAVTNDNTSNPKVTRRDRDLKNEILRTFQDQFANNQL
ncbi:MAG: hypothetical protein ACRC6M_14200, partial [Microcystaceae cyanobacterium]